MYIKSEICRDNIFNINEHYSIIAAIFFITYEGIKQYSQPYIPDQYHSIIHMIAASSSEMVNNCNHWNKYWYNNFNNQTFIIHVITSYMILL